MTISNAQPCRIDKHFTYRAKTADKEEQWMIGLLSSDGKDGRESTPLALGWVMDRETAEKMQLQLENYIAKVVNEQAKMAKKFEDTLRHLAENGFARKDWRLAQLVLNGETFEDAKSTIEKEK